MVDGVRDRRPHADGAQLADARRAQWAGAQVDLVLDERGVQVRDVGVDGHQVAGQVLGEIPAEVRVDLRRLQQRLIMPPVIWLRAVRSLTMRPAL